MNKIECSYHIHNIPENDRPRERLVRHGPESLSTSELIAVILGSGTKNLPIMRLSQEIIAHFGSADKLAEATIEEFCRIKGVGKAKAIQLKAAIALGTRATKASQTQVCKVLNPQHAYQIVRELLEGEKQERFVVILLDVKGGLIHTHTVAIGTLSHSIVHPREVFYPAVRHTAASIVLAHNHPSGDPTPSKEDIQTTAQLIEAGRMMGIPVNDHLIIGRGRFISLRQEKFVNF